MRWKNKRRNFSLNVLFVLWNCWARKKRVQVSRIGNINRFTLDNASYKYLAAFVGCLLLSRSFHLYVVSPPTYVGCAALRLNFNEKTTQIEMEEK